ncbi:MAG: hypothetical protein PV344_05470, partial [Anaplasma sp.]|nr:hypothetical protein [Anaplasma sp.]
ETNHQILPGAAVAHVVLFDKKAILRITLYCKRQNFHEDLIFANFANRLRFGKNSSREQFGQYVNTTKAIIDLRKLEAANNFRFSALARFAKIWAPKN